MVEFCFHFDCWFSIVLTSFRTIYTNWHSVLKKTNIDRELQKKPNFMRINQFMNCNCYFDWNHFKFCEWVSGFNWGKYRWQNLNKNRSFCVNKLEQTCKTGIEKLKRHQQKITELKSWNWIFQWSEILIENFHSIYCTGKFSFFRLSWFAWFCFWCCSCRIFNWCCDSYIRYGKNIPKQSDDHKQGEEGTETALKIHHLCMCHTHTTLQRTDRRIVAKGILSLFRLRLNPFSLLSRKKRKQLNKFKKKMKKKFGTTGRSLANNTNREWVSECVRACDVRHSIPITKAKRHKAKWKVDKKKIQTDFADFFVFSLLISWMHTHTHSHTFLEKQEKSEKKPPENRLLLFPTAN